MLGIINDAGVSELVRLMMFGAGGATFLFGAWMPMIGILMVFIALDLLTGIAKGVYNKNLRSRNMSQGMISKAMYFVILVIANMLDVLLFGALPVTKTAVLVFYIGLEGLSIIENLALMNVPMPSIIKSQLMVLKEKGDTSNTQITVQPSDKQTILEFSKIKK